MTRTLVILFIYFFFVSCEGRKSIVTPKSLKQDLADSLLKYSNLTEALQRDDSSRYVLYLREVNKHKIGVVAITDSILFLLNLFDKKWIQIDSVEFETYAKSFEILDLNADNNDDFIVYGHGDVHGQSKPYVFMSDTNGILHYRSELHDLYNIRIDKNTNLVESFYTGGVTTRQYKESYAWVKDSLILVQGLEHHEWMTTFYKTKDRQRFNLKTVLDKDERIFNNSLFRY